MPRFLAGFLVASLLFGGLVVAYSRGLLPIDLEPPSKIEAPEALPEDVPRDEAGAVRGKKRARGTRGGGQKQRRYAGEAMTGDDLGGPEARNLDVGSAGGEEQLLGSEIEKGFDSVFSQVRRCLMLAADDEPVTGKIVFGLRISSQGSVTRVNLQGPAAITQSEAGDCLRKAAGGIHFRSFHGPDMLVHFPLTLQ